MLKRKRNGNRIMKDDEIAKMLEEDLSASDDSFSSESDGSSDDYVPSDSELSSSDDEISYRRNHSGHNSDSGDENNPVPGVSPLIDTTADPVNEVDNVSDLENGYLSVSGDSSDQCSDSADEDNPRPGCSTTTIPVKNSAADKDDPTPGCSTTLSTTAGSSNTIPAKNSANSVRKTKKKVRAKNLPATNPPSNVSPQTPPIVSPQALPNVIWDINNTNFVPRFDVSPEIPGKVSCSKLTKTSTEMEIFLQIFPRSLLNYMTECTNMRLEILRTNKSPIQRVKKRKTPPKNSVLHANTDVYEIEIIIGVLLVMSYNHVPQLPLYWSTNESLCNNVIKRSISRNRFILLFSKLYAANPEKPSDNVSKTYYIDEFMDCLTTRFRKVRTDSSYQSIDEAMTKFKGRSVLKQYLPMKPTKRGIKSWVRSDSLTGYTYDIRVYSGKSDGNDSDSSTLGEKVIRQMTSSVQSSDVTFAFDRFFTSVNLLATLDFPCVGTAMSNRRNMPKFDDTGAKTKKDHKPCPQKLEKSQHEFRTNAHGILATRWQDTKEVILLSNCHDEVVSTVKRRQKDGKEMMVSCPESIKFYNQIMGGVDLGDQKVRIYDMDRKSTKWWKKIMCRMIMVSVVNSWIICQELREKKFPLLLFLVPLAEALIEHGKTYSKVQRRREIFGKPSLRMRTLQNRTIDHLVEMSKTRRRCAYCCEKNAEKRTKLLCSTCKVPLCAPCFKPYHA